MRKILVGIGAILGIVLVIVWYANATSPYGFGSIITQPYATVVAKDGQISLVKKTDITFFSVPTWLALGIDQLQEGGRVIPNRIASEKPLGKDLIHIITSIHKERFDTSKPYVISAGHFAELYVRNFGLFYGAMLDPRFALSDTDWQDRQRVALQTVAVDLDLLDHSHEAYTTYFPVSPTGYMATNIYAYPSDSLFAIVWTLSSLTNEHFLSSVFPSNTSGRILETKVAGYQLLAEHKKTLEYATNAYLNKIIDPSTGLIKKNVPLSSARDQLVRQSSFYDNVVAWETYKLAHDLGLQINCPPRYIVNTADGKVCSLDKWKQQIISSFWDDKTGIFLDDLSEESIRHHIYSGDAFIVTSTQFLDLQNSSDRQMLEREIAYVQNNNLDKPFPLRYAIHDQPDRLYFFNRYFLRSYMGETIWSHWGMEYIKTLILLSNDNPAYLTIAGRDLAAYAKNIEKYGGYPELYDKQGSIYQTSVYRSLLHTGWVVNFEEALMMWQSAKSLK